MVYRIYEGPGVWAIGYAGLIMYWIVFALMAASAIAFAIMTFMRPMHQRAHGYITTAIVTIAAIAYYAMASHGGSALTANPYNDVRDIYYARYVDWFFTTPLLLLDILLLAGLPIGVTLWILLADIAMILLGLFGALSTRQERWGYYAISCAFFFIVLWGLAVPGMAGARRLGRGLTSTYLGLSAYLALLWFGYPIVWGFAEGACVISVSAEAVAYGILDILAKVGFGWAVMMSHAVISKNPVTSGSVLTNPTNSPFSAGPIDSAEKGVLSNDRGATRAVPGGAYGREPDLAPATGTTTTTTTGPTAGRGVAAGAPARTAAAV